MFPERGVSSLAIDLSALQRRTVTSFYSNLVTRPTGRAIRTGVESQLAELEAGRRFCLSILDFSQVRVLDFSCADEIVAKLLLRYAADDRPAEAYFVARGLHEHHLDAVDAVLERHDLLLVAEDEGGGAQLLGPCGSAERACWDALQRRGPARVSEVAADTAFPVIEANGLLQALIARRVAVPLRAGGVCSVSYLTSLSNG